MASKIEDNSQNAEQDAIEPIAEALSKILEHSTYACGGSIKGSHDDITKSGPAITIRWDSSSSIEKLVLPLQVESQGRVDDSLLKLVDGTQPAGFGYQGKDIIDESYRKASKLDTSAFSTNFCPYEAGIIDVIAQALLPMHPNQLQGIRAELYKLNVYGAPSGLFKPHVDTPRSELQFGSLVVCLPCPHEGGQLVVRHGGHATTFDWSGNSEFTQWAAFYSDCEHEVLEVTSGHRITLTYNLFVRRGLGELAGHAGVLDVTQIPLHHEVANLLNSPLFMPKGRVINPNHRLKMINIQTGGCLGKFCDHAYAHATEEGSKALPALLKGSDFMAYEVFRSLGINTFVRPVLGTRDDEESDFSDEDDDQADFALERVGKKLSVPCMSDMGGDDDTVMSEIYADFPHDQVRILWMNAPTTANGNMQFAYLTYGNSAEIDFAYSFCALIFVIPPYKMRSKGNVEGSPAS